MAENINNDDPQSENLNANPEASENTESAAVQTSGKNKGTKAAEKPLKGGQKFLAGVLIIGAILFSLWIIIGYWPDKMPVGNNTCYRYKFMHVTLLDTPTPATAQPQEKPNPFVSTEKDLIKRKDDSLKFIKSETERIAKAAADKAKKEDPCDKLSKPCCATIQFSALILILVAAAGFLGNMVYVSSSLAVFVGAGKFKRSWMLWYFVKPFTASGIAVFLYLALNNSSAGAPSNLNGVLATAALAGLFTDIATQKLREIFIVIFKPASDNIPDKLTEKPAKIMSVDLSTMHPDKIDVNNPNQFLISGQNLDGNNLIITILKKKIDQLTVTPTLIKFTYTVDAADKSITKFPLLVTDAKGNKLAEKDINV